MDQEAAIQAYLAKHKNPVKAEILSKYIRTPEGRNKLAASMIHPVKNALNYIEQTRKNWIDIEYPMDGHVKEYNWFMSTVPEEEQTVESLPRVEVPHR